MSRARQEDGFSLIELLVATCVFLVITSIVATALRQITNSQATIWNRTQMHSGLRGATELLQQEVGQAGLVATPPPGIVTGAAIQGRITQTAGLGPLCDPANPGTNATTVQVSSVAGLFTTVGAVPASYALITTMDYGMNRETTPVWSINSGVNPPTLTACFNKDHPVTTTLMMLGGFANGIVPPAAPPTNYPNGSTGFSLKMFGDINGDGNMVYVEYTCDPVNTNKLYRRTMAFDGAPASKPALGGALVLLSNVMPNPGNAPCFTYQTTNAVNPIVVNGVPTIFVLDVAITLTVQTQQLDPITKQFQTETKALLNVSPRNVFNTWLLANSGYMDHIQSTPATVSALLALP
jgi:prepilin-type N-terminal cleavage/methylation domain-containing protein